MSSNQSKSKQEQTVSDIVCYLVHQRTGLMTASFRNRLPLSQACCHNKIITNPPANGYVEHEE
uniref:Uncharacterized protein n=1 Tax=Manihot esculenta TaxID=3983 RepID=A0A2C9WD22_MANES